MKKNIFLTTLILYSIVLWGQGTFTISKADLQNKIKGGWAGQTIGVTFGGPYEFRFNGTMIGNMQKLIWNDTLMQHNMIRNWGLYDDLYMDLTFVEVIDKYGLQAPVDSFANAYARAGYLLWHANQAGRYNLLQGIKAPASGHWLNNPCADDIDYQIESDFAGLMSPAMPNAAAEIGNKIGHIMNYGDGWYGGVYVSAMYALAFTSTDLQFVVKEALKTIPAESNFYQCIKDVIGWHQKYPDDWQQTWFEVQRKWADEVGCPDGVFQPFNIDAKVNAAYVVIGLLYGKSDFTRTMEISTRCGQDADCNPSSAGGILGTILGYDKIPTYWKQGLDKIEDLDFKFTSMSLNDAYAIGYRHALNHVLANGGKEVGTNVLIPKQPIKSVQYEKSFEHHYPVAKTYLGKTLERKGDALSLEFEGVGYVLRGVSAKWNDKQVGDTILLSVIVDNEAAERVVLPLNYNLRKMDLLAFRYRLKEGKHVLRVELLNEIPGRKIEVSDLLVYASKPNMPGW
jgi:hypothetical protein